MSNAVKRLSHEFYLKIKQIGILLLSLYLHSIYFSPLCFHLYVTYGQFTLDTNCFGTTFVCSYPMDGHTIINNKK